MPPRAGAGREPTGPTTASRMYTWRVSSYGVRSIDDENVRVRMNAWREKRRNSTAPHSIQRILDRIGGGRVDKSSLSGERSGLNAEEICDYETTRNRLCGDHVGGSCLRPVEPAGGAVEADIHSSSPAAIAAARNSHATCPHRSVLCGVPQRTVEDGRTAAGRTGSGTPGEPCRDRRKSCP